MDHPQPNWSARLVGHLADHSTQMRIYVLPATLVIFDAFVRLIVGVDVLDLGADMALLAVALFVSLLVDDIQNPTMFAAIDVLFIFVGLMIWMLCLKIASETSWTLDSVLSTSQQGAGKQGLLGYIVRWDFRYFLAWFLGIVAFIFSTVIANAMIL